MDFPRDRIKSYHMDSVTEEELDPKNIKLYNKKSFSLFTSEFLGTFIFVYLGQATITSFELTGTQNDTINRQLATTLTHGLAYLLASLLAINLSGAHLNPAYTVASALYGYMRWSRAFNYLSAQYLASFVAALFLHVTYNDKLAQRHSEGLLNGINATLRAHGNILSTGKLFSSYPPTEVSLGQLFVSYILATTLLIFMLITIQDSKLIRVPLFVKPIYMAAALVLIQAGFSANGGPVLNPAQDLSPRLYISICGWGTAAFNMYNHHYWWLCGFIAPHIGAIIGFGLYHMMSHIIKIKDRARDNSRTDYSLSHNNEF